MPQQPNLTLADLLMNLGNQSIQAGSPSNINPTNWMIEHLQQLEAERLLRERPPTPYPTNPVVPSSEATADRPLIQPLLSPPPDLPRPLIGAETARPQVPTMPMRLPGLADPASIRAAMAKGRPSDKSTVQTARQTPRTPAPAQSAPLDWEALPPAPTMPMPIGRELSPSPGTAMAPPSPSLGEPSRTPLMPAPDMAAPPPIAATDPRLGGLQSQLSQLQQPVQPQGFWGKLGQIGQGISTMNPAQFQQIQQEKIGQQFAQRQVQQQNLAAQIKDIEDRKRQAGQDALAQNQYERQNRLADVQQRGIESEIAQRNEPQFSHFGTAAGGELYGSVQGGKFTKQGEIAPSQPKAQQPNTPFEVWHAANPTKTVEDWLKLNKEKPDDQDVAVELTPEALDVSARRYLQDGTLPPMGMGAKASGARSRILNRAAQIDPQAAIAANKAEYDSNKSSLTQLQKSSDAVTAFERTAKNNLDQFIKTARAVRDSGSPWINRGLRSIDRNALGSTDQTAYDAARQVAFTEIARVVSNPNLTGVLSDNARTEMEAILTGDATLAQTLRAAEILTADMANRRGSIDQQIQTIKERLKTPPTGTPATSGGTGGGTGGWRVTGVK